MKGGGSAMTTDASHDAPEPSADASATGGAEQNQAALARLQRFCLIAVVILLPLLIAGLAVTFVVGSGMRPSLQGKFINAAAWHIGLKDDNPNGDPQAAASIPPPRSLASNYRVTTQQVNGRVVWTITPKVG